MRIFMPAAAATTAQTVDITGFAFKPAVLNVAAGDPITFINHDQEAHTVVAQSGAFKSSGLDTNDRWSVRIAKPGTYPYFCSLHPYMKGTIVVRAVARRTRGLH